MIYKVLHPNGVDVLVGKPGVSLQIKGDVSVRWVEVSGEECTVALGSEPSMILLDTEELFPGLEKRERTYSSIASLNCFLFW